MRYSSVSPIAQKQMMLYGGQPVTAQYTRFGRFGAAGTSVFSGPPVGAGAGKGAATGAAQGASLGSAIVPGIGTAIGAVAGAIGGAIAGSINKVDPEVGNFDQAVALWQQNPNNVYAIANKYLPLAGLFDLNLKGPHIPIYIRYNRQAGKGGEEKFVNDFVMQIYQAAQAGKIGPNDTPLTIMTNVIQPWIDAWGFGPMQDPHADLINKLMIGMIADYVSGSAPQIWRARGGDLPGSFAALPPFALRAPAPAPTPQINIPSAVPLSAATVTGPVTTPAVAVAPPRATAPIPVAPAPPATILTADGSTATSPGTGLRNPAGQVFYLGPQTPGDPNNFAGLPVWISGQQQGYVIGLLLANGGQVYSQNAGGEWWQWNGTSWFMIPQAPTIASSTPAPQTPSVPTPVSTAAPVNTTVPIPAGYTSVGTDASTGVPVYQGLNGLLYEWNGTTMTPLNGTALIAGNPIAAVNGSPQQVASGSLPALPSLSAPPSLPASGPDMSQVPVSNTPAPSAPVTAGVSSAGVPSWLTWGAVAAGAYFLFATARPARRSHGS